ncbi:MAG TPA: hypothetical protein VMZ04_05930, partial [Anaerolineae bacterium]|nr:hypothetical protein [Anaerolineae bacterium]
MLTKAIAALDKGDPTPIEKMGFEQVLINTICHILHNYSFESRSPLHEVIAVSLSTHAPLRALHRLERFIEAADKRLAIPSIQPELPCILARVFATSGALSGRLISDLTLVHMLEELKTPLTPHFDRKYYLNSITENLKKNNIYSEKVKIVHQVHSIELMRICARNADPETGISEINTELSSLAEATVEACLSVSAEELYARIGSGPCPHSLVVLGLGKLGGQELNVSSDIDLIYLCNDTSEKWAHYDTIHYHTMLAEHLTKLLTEATDLGALYRVDTRLRADGISGPLVRTTKDYFRYLELRGEAWERQMLLKARPVAGDYKFGQQFLDSLNHFIYPTSITRSPNREIVELKNRIEARLTAEGSEKTHLKLMPGGIRDIEFVVQCLQLLTGGIHPKVRNTGTLTGLERLRSVSALSPEEYKILSDAYIIYRKVENALQWRDLLPAFTLPVSAEDMNELASYLQFAPQAQNPASVLLDELERNCKAVRGIYNEIFSAHSNDSFEQMALYAASNPSGSEKVRRFMESLGFNNPIENVRTLSMLAFGDKRGLSPTGLHSSLERFIPKLLRSLSNLPDPSGALERFTRLTESYRARYTLFDVLDSHPSVFELVITITHGSGFITDILVRDPSLLDWLVETGGMLHPIDTKKIQNELKHIDNENNTDK